MAFPTPDLVMKPQPPIAESSEPNFTSPRHARRLAFDCALEGTIPEITTAAAIKE
jgi:hypothetical protein